MMGELIPRAPAQAKFEQPVESQEAEAWRCASLGDGLIAVTPVTEIQEQFLALFGGTGEPVDMAVFTRLESEGRLHCQLMAYFSPAAREFAMAFDASPCAKPSRPGLELLAGDPQAWSVLFGESS